MVNKYYNYNMINNATNLESKMNNEITLSTRTGSTGDTVSILTIKEGRKVLKRAEVFARKSAEKIAEQHAKAATKLGVPVEEVRKALGV